MKKFSGKKYWYVEGLTLTGVLTLLNGIIRVVAIPLPSQADWFSFGSGALLLVGTLCFYWYQGATARWVKVVLTALGLGMVLIGLLIVVRYRELWWQGSALSLAGLVMLYLTRRVLRQV